jgi:hypothetical protein
MDVYKNNYSNGLVNKKYVCVFCGFNTNEIIEMRRHKSICKYYIEKIKRDLLINDHLVTKQKRKYVKHMIK